MTPTAGHRRFVIGLMVGLSGLSTALLPVIDQRLVDLPSVVPFYAAGVFTTDLVTSVLLFSQFLRVRAPAFLLLAGAYLFTAGIVLPHVLTFPGLAPDGGRLLGGPQSSAWLWHFWHLGFPLLVLGYVLTDWFAGNTRLEREHAAPAVAGTVAVALAAVGGLTLLATAGHDSLPLLHDGRSWNALTFQLGWAMVAVTLGTMALLWWTTGWRSFLHLWLALALLAFFLDMAPNLLALSRYSVGWYLGRFNGLVAASVLLILFLYEMNRLYGDLEAAYADLSAANTGLERRVAERTRELADANRDLAHTLAERETLLREVYHRVKNNLQLVDSFITLQLLNMNGTDGAGALAELRTRIHTLGIVHHELMRSPELAELRAGPFLDELCRTLSATFTESRVTIEAVAEPVSLDLDTAVPLGLLVTEIVSAQARQAPEGGQRLTVRLFRGADGCTLRIAAPETPADAPAAADRPALSTRIIAALTQQLKARPAAADGERGTLVSLHLPLPEAGA